MNRRLRQSWSLNPQERNKRIEGELLSIVEAMSPEAGRLWMERMAPELCQDQSSVVLEAVYEVSYRWRPVDIITFCTSADYLGRTLRGKLFPQILEDLEELFEGHYMDVLLKGAIGWGKTTMAYVGIAYDLYKVSCLRSPSDTYGLLPSSNVAFVNVSVTKTQAAKILYGGLQKLICDSPYFRDFFPYNHRVQTELRFPKGVICYPVASNEQSLLGEGVFSAAFDEMNFYPVVEQSRKNPEGGTYDEAVVLYDRLSRRIRSRMNHRGRLPGHLWLISSSRYPNDFTERKQAEARTNSEIFVRDYTAWETRPRKYFVPQTFKLELGDATKHCRVLTGEESDVNLERVIEVPMDFKGEFDKDPDGAARDFAGVSTLAVKPYLVRRNLVAAMFAAGEQAGLKHPFTKLEVTLQEDDDTIVPENLPWIDKPKLRDDGRLLLVNGVPVMERKPFPVLFYVHIDLAKSRDACGIAVCYINGSTKVLRGVAQDKHHESRPLIRVALILRVVAPPQGEILASNVRGVLYKLTELGMEFGKITYDSWGSHESIQILQSDGYNAETLSVDATTEPYDALKEAIYDGRLLCYYTPKLEEELLGLQLDAKKNKIDHRPNGSKDLADALAGAVYHCEQAAATSSVEMAAPTTNPPLGAGPRGRSSREEIIERIERGEVVTEEEFDRI